MLRFGELNKQLLELFQALSVQKKHLALWVLKALSPISHQYRKN